jgi:predicted nucleic acid-binding protein
VAARLLETAETALTPNRSLLGTATRITIELDHPAYDCLYLALAIENDCRFVTADQHFLRKVGASRHRLYRAMVASLTEVTGEF